MMCHSCLLAQDAASYFGPHATSPLHCVSPQPCNFIGIVIMSLLDLEDLLLILAKYKELNAVTQINFQASFG